jgi:hypothetical protein
LAAFEKAKTAQRISELQKTPVAGPFNTAHLKTIHRRAFQDVFPWAGEFRTPMLGKAAGMDNQSHVSVTGTAERRDSSSMPSQTGHQLHFDVVGRAPAARRIRGLNPLLLVRTKRRVATTPCGDKDGSRRNATCRIEGYRLCLYR